MNQKMPDRPIHNFEATKSVVRRFWTFRRTPEGEAQKLWKGQSGD